jgi:hypothetical protein
MGHYAAACCCKPPDDDDGPDGPIIDSQCCDDHNPIIEFQVDRSSRHNYQRVMIGRSSQTTTGYERSSLVGSITWDLSTNIITHTLQYEYAYVQVCDFSCDTGPCSSNFQSCPCTLNRRADGAQRWPAQVSVMLLTPGNNSDLACGDLPDREACYLRVRVSRGFAPIESPYGTFSIQTDCDGYQGDEQGDDPGPDGTTPGLGFNAYFKIDRDQSGFCTLGDLDLFVNTELSIHDDPPMGGVGSVPYDNDPAQYVCGTDSGSFSRNWFESSTDSSGCVTAYGGTDQITFDGGITGAW